jgi:hypothetical protein
MTLFLALVLATPGFPSTIASSLKGPAPACAVCHAGGATARGTVTTPFGKALRSRGLEAWSDGSLTSALGAMMSVDSDGDGTPDLDELAQGGDPNAGNAFAAPSYGCSSVGAASRWSLAALALVLRARRRRSRGVAGGADLPAPAGKGR